MESIGTLIVGAGMTGLAVAAELSARGDDDYLVLEADREIGGYCKTVERQGFVWDYSGHFFHFKHPEIEQWLRERMPEPPLVVHKKSYILYKGRLIDFPFQKNIHQLPQDELIDCLYDLYFARSSDVPRPAPPPEENFKQMLQARFGRSICDKFLFPYNEKLYACDLASLDKDAMGRFFPHANLTDVIANMKQPDNSSYNATFTYPPGGAVQYVNAVASAVRPGGIACEEALLSVDVERHLAATSRRTIRYRRMASSIPFNRLAAMCALDHDRAVWTWNKVLVFNLGFDKKGYRDIHWAYFPDPDTVFYRVGWYDNILGSDRMSLYVEIGLPSDAAVDAGALRERVLADLARQGICDGHKLLAEHSVVLDPAYVHITRRSLAEHSRLSAALSRKDVWPLGRYGGWTYCAIEDNLLEARAWVARWA